jgi:hypothetical protein
MTSKIAKALLITFIFFIGASNLYAGVEAWVEENGQFKSNLRNDQHEANIRFQKNTNCDPYITFRYRGMPGKLFGTYVYIGSLINVNGTDVKFRWEAEEDDLTYNRGFAQYSARSDKGKKYVLSQFIKKSSVTIRVETENRSSTFSAKGFTKALKYWTKNCEAKRQETKRKNDRKKNAL